MKMSLPARLVAYELLNSAQPPFDKEECEQIASKYFANVPKIGTLEVTTIDEADRLAKELMDFVKGLADVRTTTQIYGTKMWVVAGLVIAKLNVLHLEMEQLLFNMGVVSAGDNITERDS